MSGLKFIDVGANLTDEMYKGMYNGSKKHEPDLDRVLQRSWAAGLEKIIITAGNLEDARVSLELARTDDRLFTTVGVHPTRCNEFKESSEGAEKYLEGLKKLLAENKDKIVAIGEFGLDYDRTKFCEVDVQREYFQLQLKELAENSDLPVFLHCRAAAEDLHSILSKERKCFPRGGVVHSFDGTLEEMERFVDLGLHIGINGCSLKTEECLEVIKDIPNDKLLLETDAPWCGIRPSHAGSKYIKTKFEAAKKNWSETTMFKQRNEPQTIVNVLEIVAGLKSMDVETLGAQVYENSVNLFFPVKPT
jgi:TatD DNase family protein